MEKKLSTTESSKTWHKTAGDTDGTDWVTMNSSQKRDIVTGVLLDWKAAKLKVTADASYFIQALDAFYGDKATDSTNLAQAMSMTAAMGGVISK